MEPYLSVATTFNPADRPLKKKEPATSRVSTSGSTPLSSKPQRASWKTRDEEILLQWMETSGNYKRFRCAAQATPGGRSRTSGDSKIAISEAIVLYLAQNKITKTGKQVRTKIEQFETTWKKAHQLTNQTGEGVTDEDLKHTTNQQVLRGKRDQQDS